MDPKSVYESKQKVQILDVRERLEWKMGHIEGAQHIPMGEISSRLDEIPNDKPLVAVCGSGVRSKKVTQFLRQKGFEIENLDGGMKAWKKEGLPVVSRGLTLGRR